MSIFEIIRNAVTDDDYHHCAWCHQAFVPKRKDAKTCSPGCRQALYRFRKARDIRWYETATERQFQLWRQEAKAGRVTDDAYDQ